MPLSSTDSSSRTSRERFEFRDIDAHNIHGVWSRHGNRAVEVIRAYEGEWFCFATIDDHVCKGGDEPLYTTHAEAMKWARDFLGEKITPETWPNCVSVITGAA